MSDSCNHQGDGYRKVVMKFTDSSSIVCITCVNLNELCPDCLENGSARDAEIAHEIVDDRNVIYRRIWSVNKGLESGHEWISNWTRTPDGKIRQELVDPITDLADRFFNLEESLTLTSHESICSVCNYVINAHAVCPNCN